MAPPLRAASLRSHTLLLLCAWNAPPSCAHPTSSTTFTKSIRVARLPLLFPPSTPPLQLDHLPTLAHPITTIFLRYSKNRAFSYKTCYYSTLYHRCLLFTPSPCFPLFPAHESLLAAIASSPSYKYKINHIRPRQERNEKPNK